MDRFHQLTNLVLNELGDIEAALTIALAVFDEIPSDALRDCPPEIVNRVMENADKISNMFGAE